MALEGIMRGLKYLDINNIAEETELVERAKVDNDSIKEMVEMGFAKRESRENKNFYKMTHAGEILYSLRRKMILI